MLHELLTKNRDEIVRRCEAHLARRHPGRPREELLDTIPAFIDELIKADRGGLAELTSLPSVSEGSRHLGEHRFHHGYEIADLARDYGTVSEVIGELAIEQHVDLDPASYKLLNACMDHAVAEAITQFAELTIESEQRDVATWLGKLGHELRNALGSAMMAYSLIRGGQVGANSRTARVLERSLNRLDSLINQTLAAVQLRSGTDPRFEPIDLRELVEDIASSALHERDIELHVNVQDALVVRADPGLLESALTNVVQNAIKYTRSRGTIEVRARATAGHVTIEVEDECGGIEGKTPEELFGVFVQGKHNRRGIGLGLAITKQAIETLGGSILVHNHPPKGCVFAIVLPQGRY